VLLFDEFEFEERRATSDISRRSGQFFPGLLDSFVELEMKLTSVLFKKQ
jgi:hypothetical protein